MYFHPGICISKINHIISNLNLLALKIRNSFNFTKSALWTAVDWEAYVHDFVKQTCT